MKFDFSKSNDLQNKLQLQLQNINKNVLYCTHRLDKLVVEVSNLRNDMYLQKQANEYYQEHIDSGSAIADPVDA